MAYFYCAAVIPGVYYKHMESLWLDRVIPKFQAALNSFNNHDDVIKWKHFPRYWPFVQGIYRWPVNSSHKGQWRGTLVFSLICAWINCWINNREADDLRRHRAHYDVIVMTTDMSILCIVDDDNSFYGLYRESITYTYTNCDVGLNFLSSSRVCWSRHISHFFYRCCVIQ